MSVNVKSLRIGSPVLVDGERVRVCGVTRRKVGYHPIGKPSLQLRVIVKQRLHTVCLRLLENKT